MKRWIIVLLAAMLTILQTGAFAESDDEIRNYTRNEDAFEQRRCDHHDFNEMII